MGELEIDSAFLDYLCIFFDDYFSWFESDLGINSQFSVRDLKHAFQA